MGVTAEQPSRLVVTRLSEFTPALTVVGPLSRLVTPGRPVSTLNEGTLLSSEGRLTVAPAHRDSEIGATDGKATPVTEIGVTALQPSKLVVTRLNEFTPALTVVGPVRILVTPGRPVSTLSEGTLLSSEGRLTVAPAHRDSEIGATDGKATPVTEIGVTALQPSRLVVMSERLLTPTEIEVGPVSRFVTPGKPVSTLSEGTLLNNEGKLIVAPAHSERLIGATDGKATPVTLMGVTAEQPNKLVVMSERLFTPALDGSGTSQ